MASMTRTVISQADLEAKAPAGLSWDSVLSYPRDVPEIEP